MCVLFAGSWARCSRCRTCRGWWSCVRTAPSSCPTPYRRSARWVRTATATGRKGRSLSTETSWWTRSSTKAKCAAWPTPSDESNTRWKTRRKRRRKRMRMERKMEMMEENLGAEVWTFADTQITLAIWTEATSKRCRETPLSKRCWRDGWSTGALLNVFDFSKPNLCQKIILIYRTVHRLK